MKKMRRLIPAIAMLLVSAVMLSTASFAWFTLNDEVTASGMQIQAKATGSLVIGTAPLTYASAATKADLTSETTNKLSPMTWGVVTEDDAETEDDETVMGWIVPDATIDPDTGHFVEDEAWEGLDFVTAVDKGGDNKAEYYVEKVLYIGSAGDKLTGQYITIDLEALVAPASEATKAYAIAIYVNEYDADINNWAETAPDATPTARIYVDSLNGRNTIVLKGENDAGYTIPSIVGVGAQDEKVTGIQIVVRFYVDGALDAIVKDGTEFKNATKKVVTGYKYEEAKSFSANGAYYVPATYTDTYVEVAEPKEGEFGSYYVQSGDTYVLTTDTSATTGTKYFTKVTVPATYVPAVITDGMTGFPEGVTWYTRTVEEEDKEYKYVNSKDVPTSGTSLEITISSDDKPAAGN